MISDLTRDRLRRFRKIKRAWYSLLILGTAFLLSLFSEFIANDKPLLLRYRGRTYFPVVKFYPASGFGGEYGTEPDYLKLRDEEGFKAAGGSMVFPIIADSPLRTHLELQDNPPHAPSRRHLLGTDNSARDVLSRLIYGFRICMAFALLLAFFDALLGITIGGIQGYLGGKVDITVQRLIEIWSALPFLYVVILLGSIYGRTFGILLFITALFEWVSLSYFMRGEFLRLKGQTYVKAARALGFGPIRIFFNQILPNALTPVITLMPFTVVAGISALTALDFLGFGLMPPTPSWGEILKQGLENIDKPWLAISSTTALFVTLMLATFIGEGVREAFDPRSGHHIE
ncbi:MAG: putative oligopeptide/dipeptide transporter, permease protein [Fibrobacteres bacterium]|nr:putative oligopeptide/dipeptide transporter, permease protein [Fibrobacterota bacterium]